MKQQRFLVETKEAYDVLMDELNKLGYVWYTGKECKTLDYWNEHGSKTIIYVGNTKRLMYGNYTSIHKYKEYGEPIEFKKSNSIELDGDQLKVIELEPTKSPVVLPNCVYDYLITNDVKKDGKNVDNVIFRLVGQHYDDRLDTIIHHMSKEDGKEFKKFMYQTDSIFQLSDALRYGFIRKDIKSLFKIGDMVVLKDGKNPQHVYFENPQFPLEVTTVFSGRNQVQLFEKYEDVTQLVKFEDVEKIKMGTE